jgi:hypothetical protein
MEPTIPTLGIFGLGYNKGLLDYARDPEAKEWYMLDTALAGVAATSQNIIQDRFDNRYQQVQRVGNWMLQMAKAYVDMKMAKSIQGGNPTMIYPSRGQQGCSTSNTKSNNSSSSTTSEVVYSEWYQQQDV